MGYIHRNESIDYVTIFDKGNRYEIGPGEEKELPCRKPGWGIVIVEKKRKTVKNVKTVKPEQKEHKESEE